MEELAPAAVVSDHTLLRVRCGPRHPLLLLRRGQTGNNGVHPAGYFSHVRRRALVQLTGTCGRSPSSDS